jgi:hypothetical protein
MILKEAKVLHGPQGQLIETEWSSYSFIKDRSLWWHKRNPTKTVQCIGGKYFPRVSTYMEHIDPDLFKFRIPVSSQSYVMPYISS